MEFNQFKFLSLDNRPVTILNSIIHLVREMVLMTLEGRSELFWILESKRIQNTLKDPLFSLD